MVRAANIAAFVKYDFEKYKGRPAAEQISTTVIDLKDHNGGA
jgi:hypothetical protein